MNEELKVTCTNDVFKYSADQIYDYIYDLQQENQQLKVDVKALKLIVGTRQKRNLIRKFNKEYDAEDKRKNPNRDYVFITPDAEEVYKRYYELQQRIEKAIEYINGAYEMTCYTKSISLEQENIEDLLSILKGEEK